MCLDGVQAAFFTQYGKKLYVREDEMARYLMDNNFDSYDGAMAHFKRAISYYAGKYAILPNFKHLTSPKIPALVDVPDWERALYATYPDFSPVFAVPNENKLDSETHGYSGLFPSIEIIELILDFAKHVAAERVDTYIDSALVVVERLVFSMAYRQWGGRGDYAAAIEAQKKLARLRVSNAKKVKVKQGGHWSVVLVPDQEISVFGVNMFFWEVPKVVVSIDFAAREFNLPKYTQAHAKAALETMIDYASDKQKYLKFLLTMRPAYMLDVYERELWREQAPNIFPEYPY